jgi:alanine racemase
MYQKMQVVQLPDTPVATVSPTLYCNSWIEISKAALLHNIAQYKQIVGNRELAVVVKSNAYGHGISAVAQVCEEASHVSWLCTASLSEALQLRYQGITKPILVLSYLDADLAAAVAHDIDLVIYDGATLLQLQAAAVTLKKKARIHVKVDTGLSRLGVAADCAFEFICAALQLSHISVQGIFTHLAESEKTGRGFTLQQITQLHELKAQLAANNNTIPYHHYSCTAAVTAVEEKEYNFARMGLGVYGLWPSKENKIFTQKLYPEFSLLPVMSWKTRIIQIKKVPQWSFVGYARTHTTTRDTTLAVLPVGYWEGYDRKLSNQAVVLINGVYAPVVGRISMNVMSIDITDLPGNITVGTEVTLLGADKALSAETFAEKIGTINWEVVTRINPLLPRIIV